MIAGHEQVIMSTQELIDCTDQTASQGCSGGNYWVTYQLELTNMTMRESDYPYTSGSSGEVGKCQYDEAKGVAVVATLGECFGTGATLERLWSQPVNLGVAAGNPVFTNYKSGILTRSSGCP